MSGPRTIIRFRSSGSWDACTTARSDARADGGWDELKRLLDEAGQDRIRAFYLAVGPGLFADLATRIDEKGLANEKTRLVVEKPVGRDLESAKALNETIAKHFGEHQVFRIDHYLGKETVQNLMALRFANALYEPVWNSTHIDHVQITVAESVGLEGRAGYYDTAGALRDMVQNHIVQLMTLVALEPPSSLDSDALRDEKLKVLRALAPIQENNVESRTVRGQYRAGASNGGAVKSYLDDLGEPESDIETFVAIKAEIGNWRLGGRAVLSAHRQAPVAAPCRRSSFVTFKPIPHSIFENAAGNIAQNQLVMRLQPDDEGVKQWLMIKDPGPGGMRLAPRSAGHELRRIVSRAQSGRVRAFADGP